MRTMKRFFGGTAQTKQLLFTPGPLLTSPSVKASMQKDMGSRDPAFIKLIQHTRDSVVKLANVSLDDWTSVFVQGSGTFGIEATLQTLIPKNGHILVISNGAYGERAAKICQRIDVQTTMLRYNEDEPAKPSDVAKMLEEHNFTTCICIHSETTSGIVNPVEAIGAVIKKKGNISFIVDAMSSFGGIPVGLDNIDAVVTSANKCIEGVPGFAISITRKELLEQCKGNARSLSLDLYDQWKGLEANGQFRFTPPTHTIIAFEQALKELEEEGGVPARQRRYQENRDITIQEFSKLGFETYLPDDERRGHIITSFRYPDSPNWNFETFYQKLSDRGCLIYPGKVSNANCFRIGHIGHIFPDDTRYLCRCVGEIKNEMGF